MNPEGPEHAERLFRLVAAKKFPSNVRIHLAVPVAYLAILNQLKKRLGKKILLGAQNTFWEKKGAYTGEISSQMIKQLGGSFVLIGHSERRIHLGESNEMVNKKLKAALTSGLTAILCVGEHTRSHSGEYIREVREQLQQGLQGISSAATAKLIIAYEPVWAISTTAKGHIASPADALEMALYIQKVVNVKYARKHASAIPIIYGGSVNGKSAGSFLSDPRVRGLLVGAASLNTHEFRLIIDHASSA